jgi:hypothetical protein
LIQLPDRRFGAGSLDLRVVIRGTFDHAHGELHRITLLWELPELPEQFLAQYCDDCDGAAGEV